MRDHAIANSVPVIAIPFLGSGLDRLSFFDVVLPLIREVFDESIVDIHIYCPKSVDLGIIRLVI